MISRRHFLAHLSVAALAAGGRPPLAQNRVHLRPDGRLLVQLNTVGRDGPSHFLFEPIEFLATLAAVIPRPAVLLLLYHGLLAPRARWRSHVVAFSRPALEPAARPRAGTSPTPAWTWATLRRRVCDLNVLACPRCR